MLPPPLAPELKLYLADDADALWRMTEDALEEIGLPPPYWAFAWAGGQALARYLLDNPELVRAKRVLDLACGSGIVAIAAMKSGALNAQGWDIDRFAVEATKLNAALNNVEIDARAHDGVGQALVDIDIILVGDLFYERDLAPDLLNWLRAESSTGKTILVGDPGRHYLPKQDLEKIAEYSVPTTRALEDAEIKQTGVWRLANS